MVRGPAQEEPAALHQGASFRACQTTGFTGLCGDRAVLSGLSAQRPRPSGSSGHHKQCPDAAVASSCCHWCE